MNKVYDEQLFKNEFYYNHPEYLPYVGENYTEYRILLIGESHYIDQTIENEKYNIDYFYNNWFSNPIDIINESYAGWFNTRSVINNYLSGNRSKGHLIFTNVIKSFSEVVLHNPIVHITLEETQKFNYFAFMNYFQMPSIYRGLKFWDSLAKSAKNLGDKEIAYKVWDKVNSVSANVLDDVIDALKPQIIVFTSKSAYYTYIKSDAKHSKNNNIFGVVHPGCAWWNKSNSNNESGKESFERILLDCIKNK